MHRRKFIKDVSVSSAGITLFMNLEGKYTGAGNPPDLLYAELNTGFLHPPHSAKPQTWWHWRDGNITKEAITAELTALNRIGIGGVTMFSVAPYGAKPGPRVVCLSPEWHALVSFAMKECSRLGLDFNFHNCPGWSTAGGPWITPDKGMQHVVFSKHTVDGGATLQIAAPPTWPENGATYYSDIAVLAFPTPAAFQLPALPKPGITSSFSKIDLDKSGVSTYSTINEVQLMEGQNGWLQFEFPAAVTIRSLQLTGSKEARQPDDHRAMVQASDDGTHFRDVCRLSTYLVLYSSAEAAMTHAIPSTTARFFRLAWDGPAKLNPRTVEWSATPAIYSYESKIGEHGRTLMNEPVLPFEKDSVVTLNEIVDLTSQLDAAKNIEWSAPAGSWTVLRIGYRSTNKMNEPAPKEGRGLECDKFSRDAVALHFDNYIGKILADGAATGNKPAGILIDSWEARTQNWSPVFKPEFIKRRGYDVLKYLPAMAGFIVENRDVTDRFLRDIRQTCSDLVAENFYGYLNELANKHGLKVYAEACGGSGPGTMVADGMQHYLHTDIPMTELNRPLKEACSAAHLTNKSIVALEAFTQARANWQDSPASLKATGDAAICAGITRVIFHTYPHNPDVNDIYPGPAFGPYGLPFSRGQTWWEMGRAWMTYLSRCQYLLQQGHAAADVLYFYGEDPAGPLPGAIGLNRNNFDEWPELPFGFDFDLLPAEILIKNLSCKNGKLVLPNGGSYHLLVLRNASQMSTEAAEKIKELVAAGATVLGPAPLRSISLHNYPQCDKEMNRLTIEVWGNCDGKKITRHAYGKGQVFYGLSLKDTLQTMNILPDFYADAPPGADLRFIHRTHGETEIYFISNHQPGAVHFNAAFRIQNKKPELWDSVTGKITKDISFNQKNGQTWLHLQLAGSGSAFVIFNGTASHKNIVLQPSPVPEHLIAIDGPWTVNFTKGWGAPESVVFDTLRDWSKHAEPGIKYYSGTAIYTTSFEYKTMAGQKSIYLDLGKVAVIAEVVLNGKDCGIAWTPPYRVDISKALKRGSNTLEIRVANTWANRLMGDGLVPGATLHTWTTYNPYTKDSVPMVSGLIGPVEIVS